jgi:hypothetical protein
VYRQWEKRCAAVSWVCLHRGQSPQFVQPLLSSLSAVQSLSWKASQAKNLILGVAQGFQTILFMRVWVAPKNCAL